LNEEEVDDITRDFQLVIFCQDLQHLPGMLDPVECFQHLSPVTVSACL
jgi:hypothetical protein